MIYSYKCLNCGITYDVERSIHAEASFPICSECRTEMSRIWTSPPVQFKGKGFYNTDK